MCGWLLFCKFFLTFRHALVWYCLVYGLLMWLCHWPLWFPRTSAILGTRNTRSPNLTFGLFMSLTLVGLLSSRADPDCHNVTSSLQVWCSYLLLSIVLIMQQLAVCKARPVRAPPKQYGLSYWPWPQSQAGLASYLELRRSKDQRAPGNIPSYLRRF